MSIGENNRQRYFFDCSFRGDFGRPLYRQEHARPYLIGRKVAPNGHGFIVCLEEAVATLHRSSSCPHLPCILLRPQPTIRIAGVRRLATFRIHRRFQLPPSRSLYLLRVLNGSFIRLHAAIGLRSQGQSLNIGWANVPTCRRLPLVSSASLPSLESRTDEMKKEKANRIHNG